MKLIQILLKEEKYPKDELQAAAKELAGLAKAHDGKDKFVIAPTGARIPTNIATAELLVKYFKKKLADQPNIEGFEVKINQDGVPQAFFYAASAPAMSDDEAKRAYLEREKKAGRPVPLD
jgi:hypothetical protein